MDDAIDHSQEINFENCVNTEEDNTYNSSKYRKGAGGAL